MFAEILDTQKYSQVADSGDYKRVVQQIAMDTTTGGNMTNVYKCFVHMTNVYKCFVQRCQSGPKKSASAEGVGSGSPIPLAKSPL